MFLSIAEINVDLYQLVDQQKIFQQISYWIFTAVAVLKSAPLKYIIYFNIKVFYVVLN